MAVAVVMSVVPERSGGGRPDFPYSARYLCGGTFIDPLLPENGTHAVRALQINKTAAPLPFTIILHAPSARGRQFPNS